ncbi:hypothetical protein QQ020_21250 [Fulvivirgaceae bacterium BMA12]|uniref:Prokaryotic glutathione synthetase ATP-binding domain-containing protein n=1 Tax=Agaribacillus aureus TaxID=3051825 RepID=A0ABT8LBQ0_9BACT|nr:hypothetical protein [Fulvivirgaceae bacterium BMA12]
MISIGLATSNEVPQLTETERALIPHLRDLGIMAEPVIWENKNLDFTRYDYIVIRSCWDYHLKIDRFKIWLDQLNQSKIPLANPYEVVLENTNKFYLQRLSEEGVKVVPTAWIKEATSEKVLAAMAKKQWAQAVLKPVVSASAYHTYLISENQLPPALDLDKMRDNTFMLQPFLSEVSENGEWSLIFFNKAFSHAVLKQPKRGDFRVQEELGGIAAPADPDPAIIRQARDILDLYKAPLLFARVDGIVRKNTFQLMELELIEPELFLLNDDLRQRFAKAIKKYVSG